MFNKGRAVTTPAMQMWSTILNVLHVRTNKPLVVSEDETFDALRRISYREMRALSEDFIWSVSVRPRKECVIELWEREDARRQKRLSYFPKFVRDHFTRDTSAIDTYRHDMDMSVPIIETHIRLDVFDGTGWTLTDFQTEMFNRMMVDEEVKLAHRRKGIRNICVMTPLVIIGNFLAPWIIAWIGAAYWGSIFISLLIGCLTTQHSIKYGKAGDNLPVTLNG
jgi:hypothetical protein